MQESRHLSMITNQKPGLQESIELTQGMKQLVTISNSQRGWCWWAWIQLKKELWSFRTSVKRLARDVVLQYYELTSNNLKQDMRDWYSENARLLGSSPTSKEVIKLMRKQRIADLTGEGDKQRLAVFAYNCDVSLGLVSCPDHLLIYAIQCFL